MKSEASKRKKLSVYVVSMAEGGAGVATDKDTNDVKREVEHANLINDITVFKSAHEMYPLVQPYINITRKGNKCKL